MKKIIDYYHTLLSWLLVGTVAILLIPVTLQIISRYTALIPSWIWTEELSRFMFIWMVMLGAMIGVREGTHFDVDVWPDLQPRAAAFQAHDLRPTPLRAQRSRLVRDGARPSLTVEPALAGQA